MTSLPTSEYITLAPAEIVQSRPMRTPGPITAPAAIRVPCRYAHQRRRRQSPRYRHCPQSAPTDRQKQQEIFRPVLEQISLRARGLRMQDCAGKRESSVRIAGQKNRDMGRTIAAIVSSQIMAPAFDVSNSSRKRRWQHVADIEFASPIGRALPTGQAGRPVRGRRSTAPTRSARSLRRIPSCGGKKQLFSMANTPEQFWQAVLDCRIRRTTRYRT